MTLPTSLNLDGFRAAFRDALRGTPYDQAAVAACVDALQEADSELVDVLLLFAGTGPEWVSEPWPEQTGWWRVLALWCELTEPEKRSSLRGSLVYPDGRVEFRFETVRACELDLRRVTNEPTAERAFARARRDHKRAVLSLFPDVVHERRFCFPFPDSQDSLRCIMDQAEAMLREGGWRVDVNVSCTRDDERKEIRYEYILPAPYWIAPETERPRATFTGDVQVSYDGAFLGTSRDVRLTTPPAE